MTKLTRKESVDAIKEKVVDAKSSTTYSRPVGMKKKRLDSSKSVDISVLLVSWKVVKENEQIQSGLWRSSISIENLLIKESQFSTVWRMDQSVVSAKKKRELIHSLFCKNMQTEISSFRHSSRKKQRVGIIQTTTQTVTYFINKFWVTAFDQSVVNNHATQNRKISRGPRMFNSKNNERQFFSLNGDIVSDLPFNFSSSLPHRLPVFAVLYQNRLPLKPANYKVRDSSIGNGIWWISIY